MYRNNIVNFQVSTTILNSSTKKYGNLLKAPRMLWSICYVVSYVYTSYSLEKKISQVKKQENKFGISQGVNDTREMYMHLNLNSLFCSAMCFRHIAGHNVSYRYNLLDLSPLYTYIFKWRFPWGKVFSVVGNGHADSISNPERDWLHFT